MLENPPCLFYNSAPKVEQYYLQSLTYLTRVNIKYNSSHDFAAYYYFATAAATLANLSPERWINSSKELSQ